MKFCITQNDMNDYDTLFQSVRDIAEQMQELQAIAVVQYTPVVETIIATRSRDVRQIEHNSRWSA